MLGRSKDCDIQVSDPNVSRRHAEVRREGDVLHAGRPRLDERHRGRRQARQGARLARRLAVHDRLDRDRLLRGDSRSAGLGSGRDRCSFLKIAFLVLLYLFIWRIHRTLRDPPAPGSTATTDSPTYASRTSLFRQLPLRLRHFHRVAAASSVAFTDCTLHQRRPGLPPRLPRIALRSCDLTGLELDSCHLDGTDLRGSRLQGPQDAAGQTCAASPSARISFLTSPQLTVAALKLTVRND